MSAAIAAIACRAERCRSQADRTALLMRGPRQVDRGFKSRPLRHGQSEPLGFGLFPFSAHMRGVSCDPGGFVPENLQETPGGRHIVAF